MACQRLPRSVRRQCYACKAWITALSDVELGAKYRRHVEGCPARPARATGPASVHEAHGFCRNCKYPAHRYPFGWQHVGSGMFACSELVPVSTCCSEHIAGAA